MAKAAGITMAKCRLLEEGGRAHFMTERFDRVDGKRLHMQTLAALAHFDFNQAGFYSYEGALQVMRRVNLAHSELEEQFRRAVFNVIARNQDDHTKNIAFLMNRAGSWSLSPAYDITYSYNPAGLWTRHHQMSINQKVDDFEMSDLVALGVAADLSKRRAKQVIDQIAEATKSWPQFAGEAGVSKSVVARIASTFRFSA